MQAKPEFRNRPPEQVAVLDALVGRTEDGMTVLELRAAVDQDIDTLEEALSELKAAGLIEVERADDQTLLHPADRVVPSSEEAREDERGLVDALRERLGL
ncbi:MAG: DUF6432 family protein [Haloferacaceae archaeon]